MYIIVSRRYKMHAIPCSTLAMDEDEISSEYQQIL